MLEVELGRLVSPALDLRAEDEAEDASDEAPDEMEVEQDVIEDDEDRLEHS